MSDRPYSRHYHELVDDPKFAEVFPDDHHYATWSRLLMLADQAWPASAHIPASARKASVAKLEAVGLIDLLPDGRFRMHGTQKEREERAASASKAANARWGNAPRNANGNAVRIAGASVPPMPRRDETRQDETSIAGAREVPDGRKDLEAWMIVRGFNPPTPRQRSFLDGYVRTFDLTGPERAERLILSHPDDPIKALKADLDAFRAERRDAAVASEVPKPSPRRSGSGLTGVSAELAALLHAQDAEREAKEAG